MTAKLRNIDFDHFTIAPDCWSELRTFAAVGSSGSYVRAAKLLNVSVPTVARNCDRLRDIVGEHILITTSQGVRLTPAGEALFKAALAVNQEVTAALRHLGQDKSDVTGEITISVPEGIAGVFVTPNIGSLVSLYPNLSIEVLNPATSSNVSLPHIIVSLDHDTEYYDFVPLGHLHLTTIATRDYIDSKNIDDIAIPENLEFVQCSYYISPIFSHWNHVRSLGRTRFSCESSLSYVAAVMAEYGVGLLANYTLSDRRLGAVPLGVRVSIPLYVGRLKAKKRQPAVKVVFEWLLDLLSNQTPWFKDQESLVAEVKYLDLASSRALF